MNKDFAVELFRCRLEAYFSNAFLTDQFYGLIKPFFASSPG